MIQIIQMLQHTPRQNTCVLHYQTKTLCYISTKCKWVNWICITIAVNPLIDFHICVLDVYLEYNI